MYRDLPFSTVRLQPSPTLQRRVLQTHRGLLDWASGIIDVGMWWERKRSFVFLCGGSGVCKNDNYTNTIDNSHRAAHYLMAVIAPGALKWRGCDNRRTVQAENVKLHRQSCLKQLYTKWTLTIQTHCQKLLSCGSFLLLDSVKSLWGVLHVYGVKLA